MSKHSESLVVNQKVRQDEGRFRSILGDYKAKCIGKAFTIILLEQEFLENLRPLRWEWIQGDGFRPPVIT